MPYSGIEPLAIRPNFVVAMVALGRGTSSLFDKERLPRVTNTRIPGTSNLIFSHAEPNGFGVSSVPRDIERQGYALLRPYLAGNGLRARSLILPFAQTDKPSRMFPQMPYVAVWAEIFARLTLWTAADGDGDLTLYCLLDRSLGFGRPPYALNVARGWKIS